MSYAEVVAAGHVTALELNPQALILGAGVTDPKGVFGTTKAARERFPDRVIETPLSETMLTGALTGLALGGWQPTLVHARADFMTLSVEHLVNTAAKWSYVHASRSTGLPLIVRCIIGQGWGQGPQHSQSLAHVFAGVPGLDVWMPSTLVSAGAALSLPGPWPRVVFEHRRLYGTIGVMNPKIPRRPGMPSVTLIGLSAAGLDVMAAAVVLEALGIHCETTYPQRLTDIGGRIRRQPRLFFGTEDVVVVDVAPVEFGLSAEIAVACIDAGARNVRRVGPPFTPCPTSYPLERAWYPGPHGIVEAVCGIMGVRSPDRVEVEAFATGESF